MASVGRDVAVDSDVRKVLGHIASDESRHAALAWKSLRWLVERYGEPVRSAALAAFAGARPPRMSGPDHLEAHGRLGRDACEQLARRALEKVILPSARALLEGSVSRPAPQLSA